MVGAKAGLKRALEKVKNLEKDDFKQIRQWLEKDEDIAVSTVMFFQRMKKEIKRSLKVTIDSIKHPESLGANRKRNRSSVQAYPTLPTTEEVTEDTSTNETEKWVNNSCDRTTRTDTKKAISARPPDYDQSMKSRQNMMQDNSQLSYNQNFTHGAYQQLPMYYNMQYGGPIPTIQDHYQVPSSK